MSGRANHYGRKPTDASAKRPWAPPSAVPNYQNTEVEMDILEPYL